MSNDKAFLSKKVISADGPNNNEVNHNTSLHEWCATRIEPEEESNRRRSVLERIHNIVKVWIRQTMITEFRMPESAAAQVEGRIFATGSYRYNVHTSGSDIDMVLIAPSRITREHFFDILAPRLKAEPWVTDLQCIRESRVPIIAMVCDGVDIDLSFGSIRQDRVPDVITDDLLQGLDQQSVLSCNAVRVAHCIMDLVPNKATFRQTLRFVKAWGKARNVYSNMFGFPSGIGWAILTAFVCQCYPNQNAAGMVARFFRTYHKWFQPNPHETGKENRAIYLTESSRGKTHLGHSWDPRESKSDALALFPVLTPALPYGNACYNVTLTNLRQLCAEFKRGDDIVISNLSLSPAEAKASFGPYGVWSKLLEKARFLGEYKFYMHIQVSCSDPELYQAYADGVESKIRMLWAGNAASRGNTLEDYKQLRLHLNPRRYEDPAEVERRTALIQGAKHAAAAAAAAATTTATGSAGSASTIPTGAMAGGGTRASAGQRFSAGGASESAGVAGRPSNGPESGGGASALFTAHYYIGMTVDTALSTGQVDLAPAIRTFHSIVRQLRQFREGVTKLPQVTVEDVSRIPAFIKELEGYTDPTPTVGGEGAGDSPAAAHGKDHSRHSTTASGNGAAPSEANGGSASSVTTSTTAAQHTAATTVTGNGEGAGASGGGSVAARGGAKRDRDTGSGEEDGANGGDVAKAARHKEEEEPLAVEEADDLEQALGLDF